MDLAAIKYQEEDQSALANDNRQVPDNRILLETNPSVTVGPGGKDIKGQAQGKPGTDQQAQQKGQHIHPHGQPEELPGRLQGMFQSPNGARITIHIAIITIAGRIDQDMQNKKDQNRPWPVPGTDLAESEPINRHKKKGEMQPQ